MKVSVRERKLLLLIFDPASSAGEAANAVRVLFRNWINKYSNRHGLVKDLKPGGNAIRKMIVYKDRESPYGNVV